MAVERQTPSVDLLGFPEYRLPEEGKNRLNEYVENIVTNPGKLIQPKDLEALFEKDLNTRATVLKLPEGVTEVDFAGQLMLACKTESATDSYARPIQDSAIRYDQPWLARFKELWVLDERSHYAPFKKMLMEMGYSEAELDREMQDSRDSAFAYGGDYQPQMVTTFGTIQEYLTDHYYELLWKMTRNSSPEAAAAVAKIKQRETLHRVWYARQSALQVEANPENIVGVAAAAVNFSMPGNIVAPKLQAKATEWLPKMGADIKRMQRDVATYISEIAGNPERTGRLVVEMAQQKGIKVGPVTPQLLKSALNRFGPAGYGLFGEAAMEKYVLAQPIPAESIPMKVRALVRSKIAAALPDIDILSS